MSEGYAGKGSKCRPVVTTKGWKLLQVKWKDGPYDWLLSLKCKPVVVTTEGWKLQVKWKDRSYDWLPFSQVQSLGHFTCLCEE